VALIEHIKGTGYAKKILEKEGYSIIENFKEDKETGQMIEKLKGYKKSLPDHNLTIKLPSWLEDLSIYSKYCD
jgi:hypothetical protein